ncbi:MAG: acyltransferase [Alphaproteobacteria bacterium]|nr:acyltransferase [Alphaproteobacteria bacterium]
MPTPAPRFEALDLLRGMAALMIVAFHAYWTSAEANPWSKGWLAVDLFFALSGFALAHAYLDRLKAGLALRAFMILRLTGLYPLYIAGTLIGAALWWLFEVRDGTSPDPGPANPDARLAGAVPAGATGPFDRAGDVLSAERPSLVAWLAARINDDPARRRLGRHLRATTTSLASH